ncbi:MAG: AraC family transcriptional regulator [Clostridium sp.]|nr:AraC family transcriptional regulator [Clostridium sp.]
MEQKFTTRQYMIKSDFEFFHNRDTSLFEVDYHSHDFYEVYFFISGYVTYYIEGKAYKLKPGDIILVNNKEIHKLVIGDGALYERVVIWIDPDYISRLCTDSTDLFMCFEYSSQRKYNLLRPDIESLSYLRSIVTKLEKAHNSMAFGSEVLKNVYLNELIVYLNRAYLETSEEEIEADIENNPQISEIIRYINLNIDEELSLDKLATNFFISKYHLLREFKKCTGYTIHNYIQKKRLIMARVLLKEGSKIMDAAMNCGFGNYSSFSRAFKKEYGMSPREFCSSVSGE